MYVPGIIPLISRQPRKRETMTYPGQVGRAIFSIHETYGHNTCVHMYIHPLPLAHIPSVHACTYTQYMFKTSMFPLAITYTMYIY